MKKILRNIYLCIRYPFLYPRNRWTDRHYENRKLERKIDRIYKESYLNGKITSISGAIHYKFLCLCREILSVIHCIPRYTELDSMPDGWRRAFGMDMVKEIDKELRRTGSLRTYRIEQIKEKFGSLRWYDNMGTKELIDIITKYENLSIKTCINCGKKAKYMTLGYIVPFCEDCVPDRPYKEISYFYSSAKEN